MFQEEIFGFLTNSKQRCVFKSFTNRTFKSCFIPCFKITKASKFCLKKFHGGV